MSNDRDARVSSLQNEVVVRRAAWYDVRVKMRARKQVLLLMNCNISDVRKDPEYKLLRRQKKRLSKEIRHLEQKINREIARSEKEDSKKK